jgi:5-carboxymethyl-2-hydroxymuconic-semialdehyde dehydrogenase
MSDFEQNLQAANQYLQRFRANVTGHYIDGEFTVPDGSATYDNTTPTDNSSLGQVVEGSAADVTAACQAAERAFPAWRDLPGKQRRDLLHHFADMIEARAEEIALVESMDCGQPIRFMKQAAVRGAANFHFFADKAAEARNGLALHQDEHTNYTIRSPIGPVGVITPWNTPFMLSTWKIAPALACSWRKSAAKRVSQPGCGTPSTGLARSPVKPSQNTPQSRPSHWWAKPPPAAT